ncbi:NAD nucleotidase [Rhodobacteraceae bacterium IMCC1335]|jgi:5'-nucleotidase/UDP-sugar diphosphatase
MKSDLSERLRKLRKAFAFTGAAALILGAGLSHAGDLTILHINDHHSHLKPDSRMSLNLDGKSTRVRSGGMPAVVAKMKELEASKANVLKLHAGDAVSGSLFFTLFKGEADAALMNEVCFDAFALGNHEFNEGDAGLAKFLDFLNAGECNTPVLAANVKPEVGVSALTPKSETDYIQPYTVIDVAGTKVGIIGIDIVRKTIMSSSPDDTTRFLDEAETSQKMVNELKEAGVNRIVIMAHYGYKNELELAAKIDGVDVIIGGDSHTLLGDFEEIGLNSAGPYPTVVEGVGGNLVCVATAWQYSQIVGELNISFNDAGDVESCSGLPHVMVADSFKRKNDEGDRVEIEGADRDAVYAQINADPKLSIVEEDAQAASVLASFNEKVEEMQAIKVGVVTENLCLARIPGDTRSKLCSPEDTASKGSDISMLVAHAFREMAKASDIAIQNGGGVRTDIAKGDLTMGDAYKLLPFANTLVEMDMTGAEIKSVLEEALDYALQPDGSTGAYPYAAGLRWHVDAAKPTGQRLSKMEFKGRNDSSWSPLDSTATYKLVTNNYIAAGRDGYLTFKTVKNDGRYLDTYLDYAQSFVDYVRERGSVGKLPESEYSTQTISK